MGMTQQSVGNMKMKLKETTVTWRYTLAMDYTPSIYGWYLKSKE